jgi:peroxiredoxin
MEQEVPQLSDPLVIALAVALVVMALLGGLCYRLLVDRGRLLLRLEALEPDEARVMRQGHGLPAGAFLSDFALPWLIDAGNAVGDGAIVTLSGLVGRPLLLSFLHADCLFSRAFARELAGATPAPGAPLPVSIVVGEFADAEPLFANLPGVVLLDPHGQVARLIRVTATPSGYLVDAERRTVGPLLGGPTALLAVARGETVSEAATPLALSPLPARTSSRPPPLPQGAAAPDFTLPALAGDEWSLAAQRGSELVLVFTDPACPPCDALLEELGRDDQSGLVFISRGDATENKELGEKMGITAPVLLQQQREVARTYRTLETPAAFLIGAEGQIVDGPAIGQEAVLGLIAARESGKMGRNVPGHSAS